MGLNSCCRLMQCHGPLGRNENRFHFREINIVWFLHLVSADRFRAEFYINPKELSKFTHGTILGIPNPLHSNMRLISFFALGVSSVFSIDIAELPRTPPDASCSSGLQQCSAAETLNQKCCGTAGYVKCDGFWTDYTPCPSGQQCHNLGTTDAKCS